MKILFNSLMIFTLVAALSACDSLSYHWQAARGHLSLMHKRQSIKKLQQSPVVDPKLKHKFALVSEALQFAKQSLGLHVTNQYQTFVQLDTPYVTWTVIAAPEFSLVPYQWCYWVVGCASYRGYFHRKDAIAFANKLMGMGAEVAVAGVTGYSTLGWFADPVLSSFVDQSDYELLGLIFHELAHSTYYLPGDTTFNESYAMAIQNEGVKRWHRSHPQMKGYNTYLRMQREDQAFTELVLRYQGYLKHLYRSKRPKSEIRDQKQALLMRMRQEYHWRIRPRLIYRDYDGWFDGELNNAKLAMVAAYNDLLPGFNALLSQYKHNMKGFYQAVTAIGHMSFKKRRQQLSQ